MPDDFIVFPVIDWRYQRQRPQQIAAELGRRAHRVFYLTERFGPGNLPRPYLFWSSPERNVYVVELRCPDPHPNIYKDIANSEQIEALVASLGALRQSCNIRHPICLVDLPFWRKIAKALDDKIIVYDCMDHHAGFKNNDMRMLQEETFLIREADLVVTTSAGLSDRIAQIRPNVLIRNGCDVAHFRAPDRPLPRPSQKSVVGYFGSLDHWFDTELVATSARAYPKWHFVIIGRRQDCDLSALRKIANVGIIDEVPYDALPRYASGFDVCMIPFKINELTLHTNPVKMYEYLAAGKPVVGTAMPELSIGGEGMVYVAHDRTEFIAKLGEAMAQHDDPILTERRIRYAMGETWKDRVDLLLNAIAKLPHA